MKRVEGSAKEYEEVMYLLIFFSRPLMLQFLVLQSNSFPLLYRIYQVVPNNRSWTQGSKLNKKIYIANMFLKSCLKKKTQGCNI